MSVAELIVVLARMVVLMIPILIIGMAFIIGTLIERRHLDRLDQAEAELSDIMYCDLKRLPSNWQAQGASLVCGQVVIANDRFKTWIAGWINFFGGRIRGYEALLDRARREATVRMLREARANGANAVWNVRIETTAIQGKGQAGGVEIMAYGTAVQVKN